MHELAIDLEAGDRQILELNQARVTGAEVVHQDLLGNLGNAALNVGDDEESRRFYAQMLTGARARGAGMSAVYALQRLAFPQLLAEIGERQVKDLRISELVEFIHMHLSASTAGAN